MVIDIKCPLYTNTCWWAHHITHCTQFGYHQQCLTLLNIHITARVNKQADSRRGEQDTEKDKDNTHSQSTLSHRDLAAR